MSFVRVYNGTIKKGTALMNISKKETGAGEQDSPHACRPT